MAVMDMDGREKVELLIKTHKVFRLLSEAKELCREIFYLNTLDSHLDFNVTKIREDFQETLTDFKVFIDDSRRKNKLKIYRESLDFYDKIDFENLLDIDLTDEEYESIRKILLEESSIPDKISTMIMNFLLELMSTKSFKEDFDRKRKERN